jgi:transcriptional regulator with XRE-family HTH domain
MDMNAYISSKLKERRQKAGLTLEQVSRALHVTYQQVQKYESGKNNIPVVKLYEFSKLLSVPIQYFFNDVDGQGADGQEQYVYHVLTTKKAHHLNILLAEGDPADEFLLRSYLNDIDKEIKIFGVHNSRQLLSFLEDSWPVSLFPRPDLIFMDLNISKQDSYRLLVSLKKDPNWRDVPVIVLANSIYREELVEIYKNGSASLIFKSVDGCEFKRDLSACVQYWGEVVVMQSMFVAACEEQIKQ